MHRPLNQIKIVRSFFCRAILFLLVTAAFANAEILPIKTYTSADGLGSSVISYMLRDSRGFLWFATRDGLSRFDGRHFTTYRVGTRDAPPGIEQIIETRNGIYWIATTGGIYRYDPKTALPAPPSQNSDRPILNAEFVNDQRGIFYEDRTGKLWFNGNDLSIVEESGGQFFLNKVELDLPKNPSTPLTITDFRQASDGSYWIVTSWGLLRRLPTGSTILYSIETPRTDYLTSVLEDSAGRIWLTRISGVYVFKPEPLAELSETGALTVRPLDALALKQMEKQPPLPEKSGEIYKLAAIEVLGDRTTKSLYESADNHVWISTSGGIVEYDGHSFHYLTLAQGIAGGNSQIIEDTDGNLWIGGLRGLQRLDRSGLITFNEANGLKSQGIILINESAGGKLYVTDAKFNVSQFDGERFETVRPPLPLGAQAMWTSNPVFLDSRNQWWFLTNEKLYRYPATDDFAALARQKPLAEYDSRDGLKGNQMYRIYEDRQNEVWISIREGVGSGQLGLAKWSRATETFYNFSETENFPSDKSPSSFAEDERGTLWIGFYEGGLVRYRDGRFTEIGGDAPKGLVTALHLDKKGRLWISTALSGISCIEDLTPEGDLKFVAYTTANGLSSNNARSITEDNFGQIYVGTVRGIDRITPETGQIKHYTTNDGLAGDFVHSAFRASDGALWFGTPNGLSRLVPKPEIKSSTPPIWLSGLRIAGESQTISELGTEEISNLELAAAQNNLQIDFFGLDFKASESLRYQYKLEGADKDWSQPTEQRSVNYANLSAGDYRFLVRAVGADGGASANPAAVSFTVLRPVWQRWWFLILAALVIGFLIYSLYRYRIAQLLKLERVRTRIATDLHDDIGSSLSQIAILSEVVRQKVGDNGVAVPLNLIADTSREMVDSMSDIVWAINPDKDHLADLIQRMRRFASDILDAKDIAYRFHFDEKHRDVRLGADIRREVYLIFKESVNNLVKYAEATMVEMSAQIENSSLVVKVKDNGRGFVLSEESALTGGFVSKKDYDGFGGNGLINMRRRTENLGGHFSIESEKGAGTSVEINIPI